MQIELFTEIHIYYIINNIIYDVQSKVENLNHCYINTYDPYSQEELGIPLKMQFPNNYYMHRNKLKPISFRLNSAAIF